MQPYHQGVLGEIIQAWKAERRRITAGALGTALSRAVLSQQVKGISLRPTGGVYWVADSASDAWEEAQDLEELVSHVEESLEVSLELLRRTTENAGDVAAIEAFMGGL